MINVPWNTLKQILIYLCLMKLCLSTNHTMDMRVMEIFIGSDGNISLFLSFFLSIYVYEPKMITHMSDMLYNETLMIKEYESNCLVIGKYLGKLQVSRLQLYYKWTSPHNSNRNLKNLQNSHFLLTCIALPPFLCNALVFYIWHKRF